MGLKFRPVGLVCRKRRWWGWPIWSEWREWWPSSKQLRLPETEFLGHSHRAGQPENGWEELGGLLLRWRHAHRPTPTRGRSSPPPGRSIKSRPSWHQQVWSPTQLSAVCFSTFEGGRVPDPNKSKPDGVHCPCFACRRCENKERDCDELCVIDLHKGKVHVKYDYILLNIIKI